MSLEGHFPCHSSSRSTPLHLGFPGLGGTTVFRFWLWSLRMNLFPSSVEIKSFRQENDPLAPVTAEPSDFAPLVWDRPVYFRFHLVSLPGSPLSLRTAERRARGREQRWRGGRAHPRNSGVCSCVERDVLTSFSLQWPIVSRPGLSKMEADFVPCPSPTLPSSSLAYSPFSSGHQARLRFHLFRSWVHPSHF